MIPTSNHNCCLFEAVEVALYIFWFLHQTTTHDLYYRFGKCCISFDSYIKPQLCIDAAIMVLVVYLLIPTSNHNSGVISIVLSKVVYLLIPTSNHNQSVSSHEHLIVVYLLIPTSNHNYYLGFLREQRVVYLLIPTSNHNFFLLLSLVKNVVYLLIPTSNHNMMAEYNSIIQLYIFWFLHQTTTAVMLLITLIRCISFDSYIKPQPVPQLDYSRVVVYLLIPTSNHNLEE